MLHKSRGDKHILVAGTASVMFHIGRNLKKKEDFGERQRRDRGYSKTFRKA
jgi:hypothetical protein